MGAWAPVVEIAISCSRIEGLNDRVALWIPAQVVEVGVHLPPQAEVKGEISERLPIVLSESGQVKVVAVR